MPMRSGPISFRLTTNSATADARMAASRDNKTVGSVVKHRHRKAIGEHPDVVHRPDAHSHGSGAAYQPSKAKGSSRGRYAAAEIERSVRSDHRNQDGQRDQTIIVGTDERFDGTKESDGALLQE